MVVLEASRVISPGCPSFLVFGSEVSVLEGVPRGLRLSGSVTDEFLRSLWSSRLPPHVQAIIMSQTSDTLEAVAELADRICEVTPARVQQIASTGNNTNCDASLLKRIDEIVTARIRTEIANHVAQIDRQRGRSRDRFRPRGRRRKAITRPPTLEQLVPAQQHDTELEELLVTPSNSLKLKPTAIPGTKLNLYCDVTLSRPRPFVTKELRRQIFNSFHAMSHPGVKTTTKLSDFVTQLRKSMSLLRPQEASRHSMAKVFVHEDLESSSHVFLRKDALRGALEAPYTGPHKVISRSDKTITIHTNRGPVTVSIDRVKPGYVLAENRQEMTHSHVQKDNARYTRSGRRTYGY
ncbi:hypothetical protein ACJJTC_018288 [Scirpophaga incertulas]